METEEKIRKIIEFMNIPAFNQIMSAKLLELEIALAPQINYFRRLKQNFKSLAGNGLGVIEAQPGGEEGTSAFYFELVRSRLDHPTTSFKWSVVEVVPERRGDELELILNELAPILGNYCANQSVIAAKRFYSHSLKRYFFVNFTKYSESCVIGVMRRMAPPSKEPQAETAGAMIKFNMDFKRIRKEDSYGELLHYLEIYPELRERLLTYFYIMEKPAADLG